MTTAAITQKCTGCRCRFIGEPGLCPECQTDNEFYQRARKKGDPRQFIPYPELLDQWRSRRAECRDWRKTGEQAALDRAARVQAEQERDETLAVLRASGVNPDPALVLAKELTEVRQTLERTIAELTMVRNYNQELQDRQAGKPEPWEAAIESLRNIKSRSSMPLETWRRLVQLAHPDRHGNSEAANQATRWLMENRP
jgi:hypothetical protein